MWDAVYNLLKETLASKVLMFTVVITSGIILFGKKEQYSFINTIPDNWIGIITILFIFSIIFSLFQIFNSIWLFLRKVRQNTSKSFDIKPLTQLETDIMFHLGKLADESLNLDSLNYDQIDAPSKLEILATTENLSNKGLVEIHFMDENIITLSKKGRRKALEIMNHFNNSQ